MAQKKQVNPGKVDSKSSTLSPRNNDAKQDLPSRSAPYDSANPLPRSLGNQGVGQMLPSHEAKTGSDNAETVQRKANKNLPETLQTNLEASFDHDFSNVNIVKNSRRATDLNALAFTQGENIHFAPGQFNPGSESGSNLIGHEFTHVVQQRSGEVRPTSVLGKGLNLNQKSGLEAEADSLGKRAARGESIAKYQSPGLGIRNSLRTIQAKSSVVQLAKKTSHFGDWFDDTYSLVSSGNRRGVNMVLRFKPNSLVNAKLIGLTQTHQAIHNNNPFYLNSDPFYKGRAIKKADAIVNPRAGISDEGTHIDRVKSRNNPIYGSPSLAAGKGLQDTPLDNNPTAKATKVGLVSDPKSNATYQLGFNYTDSAGKHKSKDAILSDSPSIGSVNMSKNSAQIFETTALAIKGSQKDTYYGSVEWGWRTDSAGKHSKIPFKVASEGVPSSTFIKAAEMWNASKTPAGSSTIDLPLEEIYLVSNFSGVNIGLGPVYTHLPFGTRVSVSIAAPFMNDVPVRVADGPYVGETGTIKSTDLMDERP